MRVVSVTSGQIACQKTRIRSLYGKVANLPRSISNINAGALRRDIAHTWAHASGLRDPNEPHLEVQ